MTVRYARLHAAGVRCASSAIAAAIAVLLSGVAQAPAQAQTAPATASVDHSAALVRIRDLLSTDYVFEDKRAPLVAALLESEAAGVYQTNDPDQFAARVTEDFRRVTHDGHLYLRRDPARYAAMTAPAQDGAAVEALQRSRAIERNHGFVATRVLQGNIRYLKLANFDWAPDGSTLAVYEAAAAFLSEADAIILDLRGNGGGQSDAADAFTAKLLGAAASADGTRKPTFILVDGDTGSAAEAVTYDAKVRGTALIVGAHTYGAANNVRHYPIAPDLILSLSYNRPVHPLTGTNWEGMGVLPDIEIAPSLSLERAELGALEALSKDLPDGSPRLAGYAWRMAAVRAELHPPVFDASRLEEIAGRYGSIEIQHDADGLRLYRPDRPRWPQGVRLRPMTAEGLFAMDGTDDIRVQFTADGLSILRPMAAPEVFPRGAQGKLSAPAETRQVRNSGPLRKAAVGMVLEDWTAP